jgi:hypothetical protein
MRKKHWIPFLKPPLLTGLFFEKLFGWLGLLFLCLIPVNFVRSAEIVTFVTVIFMNLADISVCVADIVTFSADTRH